MAPPHPRAKWFAVCARFHQHQPRALITALKGVFSELDPEKVDDAPLYNIAPTDSAWVVGRKADGTHEAVRVRWGLLPHWAKDLRAGVRAINARAETLAEKPTFRDAFERFRCLVPVTGFYEWAKGGPEKVPYSITGEGGAPLVFAGLLGRTFKLGVDGQPVDTFSIITVPANPLMSRIHDRMPAVLPDDAWRTWLDPAGPPEALRELLRPFEHPLTAWPVSRAVGNVRLKDDASLVVPVGAPLAG